MTQAGNVQSVELVKVDDAVQAAKQLLMELAFLAAEKTKRNVLLLASIRDDIKTARTAGASYKAISDALRKAGLKCSPVEVADFCQKEFGDKKRLHAKKRIRKSNTVN